MAIPFENSVRVRLSSRARNSDFTGSAIKFNGFSLLELDARRALIDAADLPPHECVVDVGSEDVLTAFAATKKLHSPNDTLFIISSIPVGLQPVTQHVFVSP